MPRRWQYVQIVLLGIFAGLVAGCGDFLPALNDGKPSQEPEVRNARVLEVNTIAVGLTPSYRTTRAYRGLVKARQSSDLSFGRSGKLVRMLVELGDTVAAGDPIAEQDTGRLRLQRDELESTREQAETELGRMIADAKLRSMESVRIEVSDLKKELDRLKEKIDAGEETDPETQQEIDNAQTRLGVLQAVSGDPQVTAQQSVISEIEAKLADLDEQLAQGTLVAPFDGTIAQRYVAEGTMVAPGLNIVRLVDHRSPEAWIAVPAAVAREAAPGQTLTVTVGGESLEAIVSTMLPELDRTSRTRTIVFSIEGPGSERVVPGEVAQIELTSEVEDAGFWLPITALTRAGAGLWSVYAVDRGTDEQTTVSRRVVEVLYVEDQRARVRGTLDDGDRVIVDGTHRVVPGQSVAPVDVTGGDDPLSAGDGERLP